MNFRPFLLILALALVGAGCQPEEEPWTLPTPPNGQASDSLDPSAFQLREEQVVMGEDYTQVVYYDCQTGLQKTVDFQAFDISVSTEDGTVRVYLNGANVVQAAATGQSDFATVTGVEGFTFLPDKPHRTTADLRLQPYTGDGQSQVYILDLDRLQVGPETDRYWKLQLLGRDEAGLRIRSGRLADIDGQEWTVPLLSTHTRTQVKLATQTAWPLEPPTGEWDIVFTRYFHEFTDREDGDPFKYYTVTGALLNPEVDVRAARVDDPAAEALPFEVASGESLPEATLTTQNDIIGFDWKVFDLDGGYRMEPIRYYLIQDETNALYKLRFLDFLDSQGVKGVPQFAVQRLR